MDFQADGGSANPGAYFSRFNASGGGSGQVTTAAATGYLLKIDVSSGTSIGLANTSFTWFAIGH
jgi:hypothetical protein